MAGPTKRIAAKELKAALHDGGEIALLDAREEAPFDARHLLMAACAPIGRLEVLVGDLVPRRSARVVWCDDGERDAAGVSLSQKAAERMAALGFTDVAVLDGGVDAWDAEGYPIYSGVHVPSKAFAEVVEHEAGTPYITAEELKALIDEKADIAIYDTRSYEEYHANSIPGAISAPGAELVYRFQDMTPSPETLVVVNCGGRTRSIIGAQALINAGVPNRVVSLKNGTQDWHLAGFEVVEGATRRPPEITEAGKAAAFAYADRVGALCDVRRIDQATLDLWRSEAGARTLYQIDVRTEEEYAAGHAPGARHVAGGQLVQETDRHMAVWGGRAVLFDDDGVRATLTASWLQQMGWEVAIIRNEDLTDALETGPYPAPVLGLDGADAKPVEPKTLKAWLDAGEATAVDLAMSRAFYDGHIPGAWFALRSRLDTDLANAPTTQRLAFTSSDGALARLAAADVAKARPETYVLAGGTEAWRAAGLPLKTGRENMASVADDIRLRAREQAGSIEDAMRAYLAWEIELVNQMAVDDDHRFKVVAPPASA